MPSGKFSVNLADVQKALIMAIISGAMLPIAAIVQTPGFSVATTNWGVIGILALNGAFVGFVSYIVKNFLSDSSGGVLGTRFGSTQQAQ